MSTCRKRLSDHSESSHTRDASAALSWGFQDHLAFGTLQVASHYQIVRIPYVDHILVADSRIAVINYNYVTVLEDKADKYEQVRATTIGSSLVD